MAHLLAMDVDRDNNNAIDPALRWTITACHHWRSDLCEVGRPTVNEVSLNLFYIIGGTEGIHCVSTGTNKST
jgi:hypothetical protein